MDASSLNAATVRTVITAFVFADTWNETRAILDREQEVLFSPLTETILNEEIARHQVQSDDPEAQNLAKTYTFHCDLIRRCKEVGIDTAWSEVEHCLQQSPNQQRIDVLQRWLTAPTDSEKRHYLEHHLVLLEAQAIETIDRFIVAAQAQLQAHKANLEILYQQAEGDQVPMNAWGQERSICKAIRTWSKTVRTFQEHQTIIREINARANTTEAIREVAIDHWGGFAVDVPPWVEETSAQDEQLGQVTPSDEEAQKRIAIWQAALDRAHDETGMSDVVLAEMHARLFSACFAVKGRQRRSSLELGLNALYKALASYPRERYPRQWAMIQMNLGSVYQERIAGSRHANLEQAIIRYQAALQVFTANADSVRYASVQHNLGTVYSDRLADERETNLEDAIVCFRNALVMRTREELPEEYAMSQNTLGTILRERLRGFRRVNIEMGLACHTQALRVYTLEEHPGSYAATMVNLGNAYRERLEGEKRENLENALVCYQESLKVYLPDLLPLDYALVQNNLGNTYAERVEGVRRANLYTALACYQAALARRDRAQFPHDHRDTQLNIASLALDQFLPLAEEEQDAPLRELALQLADESFMGARSVQAEIDWLESDPLGVALSRGEYHSVREMHARHAFCLLLRQRPKEAIVALESGRAQAIAKERAITGASVEAVCSDHSHEFERIREQWQEALVSGGPNTVPIARQRCLQIRQTIRDHCDPAFLPGDIEYETIYRATAQGLVLVYLAATHHGGLALILRPNHPEPDIIWLPQLTWHAIDDLIVHDDADRFIVGGYAMALEYRAIHHLLRWTYYGTDSTQQQNRQHLSLKELSALVDKPFTSLKQALLRVVQIWSEECDLLESDATPDKIHRAQLLKDRLTMPLAELLHRQDATDELANDLNWYLHAIELDHLLNQLSMLGISELRSGLDALGLVSDCTRIALIPCGKLGILPLHAAPVRRSNAVEASPFFETCELMHQASARSLIDALQAAQSLPKGGILAIGNPALSPSSKRPPLPFALKEAEAIVEMAKRAHRIPSRAYTGAKATITRVRKEVGDLQGQRSGAWIHAACHGAANPLDPQRCYLLLAYQDRLTLAELQRGRLLSGIRGFVASGCVTGLGDFKRAPDELGNFASGLLLAGVACAVVTLWSVSDLAMCLLMLQFYQHLLNDPEMLPARALRQATHWLRTASRETLTQFANEHRIAADTLWQVGGRRDVLRGIFPTEAESARPSASVTRSIADQAVAMPFAEPIFWASSIMFGW